MTNEEALDRLKTEFREKRNNFRRKILGALDRRAIARLSERLDPDYLTRTELELEILETWPAKKIEQEIMSLLHKAG